MGRTVLQKLKDSGWFGGSTKTSEPQEPGPRLFSASEIELLKQQRAQAHKLAREAVRKKGRNLHPRIAAARRKEHA